MRNKKLSIIMLLCALSLAAFLNGCGSSNKEGTASTAELDAIAKVDEKTCAQCHGSSYNSQSGMPIYSEYVQSKHFINSTGTVVGCQDCHGGGAQHNGVGPIPYSNPDTAGKCFGCHKNEFLGQSNSNKTPTAIQKAHFYNITGAGIHDAMYVTKNFENGCTACHEPHNPLKGKGTEERKAWAESGHGKVSSLAFADEDFKENASCIRCHTSTGYSNFLNAGWVLPTATWATEGDKGREVLTCRTCHVNDSFAVKSAPAFVAPYNGNKSPKTFPNVGESNLCLACHSGRENEDTIAAITDFSNVSFKNSHYKAGAALMYMAAGFRNFTSLDTVVGTSTYRKTLYPDSTSVPSYGVSGGVTSTHRRLGTTAINGRNAFFVAGTADANGPCVTCHLNVNGVTKRAATGHSWGIDANAFNQICIQCHDEEAGVPLTGTNFQTIFLEEQALGFVDALDLIAYLLQTNYKIKYNPDVYPYFYDLDKDVTGNTAVRDWTRSTMFGGVKNQVLGKRLMGAAFNLNLLKKDEAAYVHARTYARRLIFDTIDYLDDNSLNFSSGNTAIAYNPVKYGKNATDAYTDGTLTTLATGTTVDMVYLLGWSRSTGKWNSPVRP